MMEVALAMTVLMVALLAMSSSTLRTHNLRRQNRERAVAQNAIRMMSEQVHSFADQVLRTSPESWSQDVVAALTPGGAIGDTFAIPSLDPAWEQETVGTIEVVVDETASDEDLGLEIGMPRDLDGDGTADDEDVTANARILPIIVRARWTGISGDVRIAHPFYVIGY